MKPSIKIIIKIINNQNNGRLAQGKNDTADN